MVFICDKVNHLKMSINNKYIAGIAAILVLILLFATQLFGTLPIKESKFFLYTIFSLILILLISFGFSKFIEKGNYLLYKEKKKSALFYLISIALIYCIILGFIIILKKLVLRVDIFTTTSESESGYALYLLMIIVAIVEELLFRGYIFTRIEFITENKWVAIISSSLLFSLCHSFHFDIVQLIGTFTMGAVFAFHYQKYNSLLTIVIVHFLINTFG
jgi:uncharacterized protein